MSPLSAKQIFPILIFFHLAARTGTEPRQGVGASAPGNQLWSGTKKFNQGSREAGKVPCPQATSAGQLRNNGCVTKYECNKECSSKIQCKTSYEYKCTDFKRRECKDVWQNKCNGPSERRRFKRSPSNESSLVHLSEGHRGNTVAGGQGDSRSQKKRVKRLIPTEIVWDPSDPPYSDLPLASETAGQLFDFASPPVSKQCWQKVRDCKWVKYRSLCRNEPVKTCEDKPTQVCEEKCKNVVYCSQCPPAKPVPPPGPTPKPPTTVRPKPPVGPPGPPAIPPPGTMFVFPPSEPNTLDVVIDARARPKRP